MVRGVWLLLALRGAGAPSRLTFGLLEPAPGLSGIGAILIAGLLLN